MVIRIKMIFRGLSASDALEGYVRWRLAEIARDVHDIVSCEVLVDAANDTWGEDGRFHALVRLGLRGGDAVNGGGGFALGGRLTAASALVDAFDVAQQALLERDAPAKGRRVRAATTLRSIHAATTLRSIRNVG